MKLSTIMVFILIGLGLGLVRCDDGPLRIECAESACKPSDTEHYCSCNYWQHMERQPDGVIICRCPTDAGH